MKRRTFLKLGSLSLATGLLSSKAQALSLKSKNRLNKRIVVLVELRGGNDGLNTLIPYADPLYYKLRPNIAIPKNTLLPITDSLAMHPSLHALQLLWEQKEMAWVQGVGYSHANRSHFRSIDIWDSASDYNQQIDQGWVANLLGSRHDISGIALNSDLGPLFGYQANSLKINDINSFVRGTQNMRIHTSEKKNGSLAHVLKTERDVIDASGILKQYLSKAYDPSSHFPRHSFGRELASIARLINSDIDIPVYKISLSNFDTHAKQVDQHAKLLKVLADSLYAFAQNMKQNNKWNDVLVMTYSEFGRQVAENGSYGTDHGEASSHFVLGGKVKGGIYGKNPNLGQLRRNAMHYSIDFRSMYGTVASQWWKTNDPWNRPLIPFI